MADYDWFSDREPTEAEKEARKWRPLGLFAVFDSHAKYRIKYYLCRRGCGCLVHDPETHIKNVCPTFEPVVE